MTIGPLEYVVVGVPERRLTHALAAQLSAIQAPGQIRVVDLLLITKDAAGAAQVQEVGELVEAEPDVYTDVASNLMGLLTPDDVERLTGVVPPDQTALVVVFEHNWVIGLTETVRAAQGTVFLGGLLPHETLAQVIAELAAAEQQAAAETQPGADTKEAHHA